MDTNYEKFDFRKPRRQNQGKGDPLVYWLKQFKTLFHEKWLNIAGTETTIEYHGEKVISFGNLKNRINAPSVAAQIAFGEKSEPAFILISRSELLATINQVVGGENGGDDAIDRALTSVEISLAEMFFQEFVHCLSESWPSQHPFQLAYNQLEFEPHRSRMYPPKKTMLVVELEIKQGDSACRLDWVVPESAIEALFDDRPTAARTDPAVCKSKLEQNLKALAILFAARLGESQLSLRMLKNIRVGDLIMFDQKISDPLTIDIQHKHKFRAWPGTSSGVQAVRICKVD